MDKANAIKSVLRAWANGDVSRTLDSLQNMPTAQSAFIDEGGLDLYKKRELWNLLDKVQSVPANITSNLVIPR